MMATFPGHREGHICHTEVIEEIRQVNINSNVLLVMAELMFTVESTMPSGMRATAARQAVLLSLEDYYSTASSCLMPWST